MTDPAPDDPNIPPSTDGDGPAPRRLTRSRADRVFGGVAGGLGRYFDVDPVVFRIGFAAATLVGGLGIFAYLAALLFVPEDGTQGPPVRSRILTVGGAALLAVAAIAALDDNDFFFGPLVPLAIAGGVGYAIFRAVRGRDDGRPITIGTVAVWVAIGVGALLGAFALALGSAWATGEGSGAVVAALVIAIGVLLVASAARGGARWLALPAVIMAVPLGIVSAADVSFDGGIGDRTYRPATVADLPSNGYRLGIGELVVDLRDVTLPPGRETVLDVGIGVGSAEVLVPKDVCVVSDTRVGGGYVNIRGRDSGGVDMDFSVRADATQAPRLLVRGDVGIGALEVLDQPRTDFEGPQRFGDRRFGDDDALVQDGACTGVEIASAG